MNRVIAACFLVLIVISGCAGTLAVGFEATPTVDPGPAATVEALRQENARLSANLATALAPPPLSASALGRVAYIRGGDLWTAVVPAGPHQRLTIDGHNREPRWSNTGEWIAFRKDRSILTERERPCEDPLLPGQSACRESVTLFQQQVWLVRGNGSTDSELNNGLTVDYFHWSPAEELLAYVTDAGHLQTITPDTGAETRLVSARPGARVGDFSWSPDGARLAFEWVPDNDLAEGSTLDYGIQVVDRDGGVPLEVMAGGQEGPHQASLAGWANDDRLLVWQHTDRPELPEESAWLYSVRVDAEQATAMLPEQVSAEPMLPYYDFVDVANAGDRPIALTLGAGLPTWSNKQVVVESFRTSNAFAAIAPDWSPEGARLAFVAMPNARELELGELTLRELMGRRIWIAAPVAGASQQLTTDPRYRDEQPGWSATGTHILFARINAEGQASLWVIPSSGGQLVQIVDELTPAPDPIGTYGHLDWRQHFDWWRG